MSISNFVLYFTVLSSGTTQYWFC